MNEIQPKIDRCKHSFTFKLEWHYKHNNDDIKLKLFSQILQNNLAHRINTNIINIINQSSQHSMTRLN